MRILWLAAGIAIFLGTGQAAAKDTLPLKHGLFVLKSVKCSNRDNASTVAFWGDQLNGAHVIGHIKRVRKTSKTTTVVTDGGMGGNLKKTVNWVLRIKSKNEFYLETEYGKDTYRWCEDLP